MDVPKPIDAGGNGDCALYSLLHQYSQVTNKKWNKSEVQSEIVKIREIVAKYMQNNAEILVFDEGLWQDLLSSWDVAKKEDSKNLQSILNINKLTVELFNVKDAKNDKLFALALLDNLKDNMVDSNKFKIKKCMINIFAEYMRKPQVQMDTCFWNIYTKLANDNEFSENYYLRQIVLISKFKNKLEPIGIWPKGHNLNSISPDQCAYIYYNGNNHYQSFNRNAIVDYLTSSQS